jgi:hypothetical protein
VNLHKRKQSPYWYARGSINGEKFFLKTDLKWRKWNENPGPDAYAAWQRVRDKFAHTLAERTGEKAQVDNMAVSLETLEKLFFREHEARHTRPKTLQGYRWIWASLHRNLGTLEAALGPRGLTEYVAKRSRMSAATTDTLISPGTVKHEVKLFFTAWKYAESFGLRLPPKPAWPTNFEGDREVNKARAGKYHPARRIYAFVELCSSQEAKDRALFIAMTGLRFEELARLGRHEVKRTKKHKGVAAFLILPPGATKGKRERIIGLTPDALAIYRRNRPFASKANRTAWRTASRKLGLPSPIHARDLRTSFASGLILGGASETHRDMVMGHWKGISSRYQKAARVAAARVARAVARWLAGGRRSYERGAAGVQSAKVIEMGQKLKAV